MTILCGTDFSEHSFVAGRAAAAVAKRLAVPLQLVHVIEMPWTESGVGPAVEPLHELLAQDLQRQAKELRTQFGIEVEPRLETGIADEALVNLARELEARWIFVASLGKRKQARWLLGSVAERVAQSSPIPVIVVRDGALEAWALGGHTLRILVGVERTPNAKLALDWARSLRSIGTCELHVAQVAWPAQEQLRLGIPPPVPLDRLRPEVEHALRAELERWTGEPSGRSELSLLVRPGWGRVDNHLVEIAAEIGIDLLVVGTHQRAGVARLWQGSVSRGVLHASLTNVACIPRVPGSS